MSGKDLPVLGLPFRNYPTKRDHQRYSDERQVCADCLSGACCESEDPICLSSFDVFRLATFFNVAPAEFLLTFTQERFGDQRDEARRQLIDNPDSSVVTYLRRRNNFSASPCIFLKYNTEDDGTPRRICSVYEARPEACRVFYFDTCKMRATGELAALLSEGYEQIRDGNITKDRADDELERLKREAEAQTTLSRSMERWFWVEMRRALNWELANVDGTMAFDISEAQDPIDEKVNRLLSAKQLRFEERPGGESGNEQLATYRARLSFASSPERDRLMTLVRRPPETDLYAKAGDEILVGLRTLMRDASAAEVFATIPPEELEAFITELPSVLLFPKHPIPEVRAVTLRDVYRAVLKGYNHLIRFASYSASIGSIVEDAAPGEVESELLVMLAGFDTSLNSFVARNPYLEPVKGHMAEVAAGMLERKLDSPMSAEGLFGVLRLLFSVRSVTPALCPKLRTRFAQIQETLQALLVRNKSELDSLFQTPEELSAQTCERSTSEAAWRAWAKQAADIRCAAEAGLGGIDLTAYYADSVGQLERIPLEEIYAEELCGVVVALARSMSLNGTIDLKVAAYWDAADRLSKYAINLFDYLEENFILTRELVSSIAAAHKSLGIAYTSGPLFGEIVFRILKSQLRDGSWDTDPLPEDRPELQHDYLWIVYRATWECVDALRPFRNDLSIADNAALGLA